MKENKKLFVKVSNYMIRKINEKESVSNTQGVLPVAMYCYIASEENYKGICKITIREILEFFGYKPNNNKGKINEKLKNSYEWLKENNYITHISGESQKIDSLIKCTVNKPNDHFTMLDYEKLSKLNNPDELILYSSLISRMKKTKECEITGDFCYPKIDNIMEDTGLADKTIKRLLDILQEKELIFYGNIGYVQREGKGKVLANNIYATDKDSYMVGLKQSKYYYEMEGYETEKLPTNYKRRDKDTINIEKKTLKEYIEFITSTDPNTCELLQMMQHKTIDDILKINVIRELNPVIWDIEKILHKNKELIDRSYFDYKIKLRDEIKNLFSCQSGENIHKAKSIVSEWNDKYNTNLKTESDHVKIMELKYNLEKLEG